MRDHKYGILIRTVRDGMYFHVYGHVVAVLPGNKVRNSFPWEVQPKFLRVDHLTLTSQGEQNSRERGLYGFSVEYRDVFSVETADAKAMLSTLTTIERKLAKIADTRGYVKSFGEYVGRVAEALGKDTVIIQDQTPKGSGGWSHSDATYRFLAIGDGVSYVDGVVRQWQDEGKAVAS